MYQVSGDELRNMALRLPGRVVPRLFFWECYWETRKDRAWRQLLPPEARALSPSCPPRLRHHHALEPLDRWLVLHWASVCLPNGPQRGKRESLGGLEMHLCCLPAITVPGVQHGNHHPLPKGLLFPAVGFQAQANFCAVFLDTATFVELTHSTFAV